MKDKTYAETENFFGRLFWLNDNLDKQSQDFAHRVTGKEIPANRLVKFRYNGSEPIFIPRASLPTREFFIKQYQEYQKKNKDIYSDYEKEDRIEIMEDFLMEQGIYYLWQTALEPILDYLHCFHSTLYEKIEKAKEFTYND